MLHREVAQSGCIQETRMSLETVFVENVVCFLFLLFGYFEINSKLEVPAKSYSSFWA